MHYYQISRRDGLARRRHPDRGAAARRELGDRRGLHRRRTAGTPGVVRGGAGRRMAPVLQPGARLSVEWTARLEEHIGTFRVDPIGARTAAIMADPAALAALGAVTALVARPCRSGTRIRSSTRGRSSSSRRSARRRTGRRAMRPGSWRCWPSSASGSTSSAARSPGATEDLVWVSPKSGRAVSRGGGAPWAERLLPLPAFLRGGWEAPPARGGGGGGAGADRLLPRGPGGAGAAARGAAGGAEPGGGGDHEGAG